MDFMTELTVIAKEHGGIIEVKIAAQHGISKAMLYKLCKEDKIHRIVKGQYILTNDMQDELLSISKRSETKQPSIFTAFLTGHLLSIPSLHHPAAFLLRRSSQSARCIISSQNCLISARVH